MLASTSSSLASASPSSSSALQEGNGIRKSGPIQLLSGGSGSAKKKGQTAYAVLSERALELYDSEKAHRKKKAHRCIVDLSKCFNVSQQNCPRTRAACVCLLMPDECFLFRGDSQNETAEWFCTLLSTVISARALNLGRPVFANEFFECVWDVTVCPQQPKLKRPPAPAANAAEFANSQNLCSIMHDLAGRKRLCFYPHTIILCKFGIEPARSGLPKSGIPPFQPIDFVEFSRHYIAQFGAVDKYFLMRIGRSSPMGSCEVWVQCESEEAAAEISRKLQEIVTSERRSQTQEESQ